MGYPVSAIALAFLSLQRMALRTDLRTFEYPIYPIWADNQRFDDLCVTGGAATLAAHTACRSWNGESLYQIVAVAIVALVTGRTTVITLGAPDRPEPTAKHLLLPQRLTARPARRPPRGVACQSLRSTVNYADCCLREERPQWRLPTMTTTATATGPRNHAKNSRALAYPGMTNDNTPWRSWLARAVCNSVTVGIKIRTKQHGTQISTTSCHRPCLQCLLSVSNRL